MFNRIFALAGKEVRHIFRDSRTLAVIFVMPVFMVLIYGYALNMDVRNISIAVIDYDATPQSRSLIRSFEGSGYFTVTAYPESRKSAEELLMSHEARCVMIIPSGFAEDKASHTAPSVQILVDGSDPTYGNTAVNYSSAIVFDHSLSQAGGLAAMPFEIRERFFFNPELRGSDFIIPGVVAVILMMVCALLTSITIAREKETGTMDILLVSPVRPLEIIVGKVIPYIVLALIEAAFILAFSRLVFEVPVRGSLILLFGLTFAYIYCALGMGLLISSVAATQQVAMMMALVATILPSMILSGFVFSIFSMPAPIRMLSYAVPARHYIAIIRGVLLKSATFGALADETGILILLGTVFLTVATLKFKTRKGE